MDRDFSPLTPGSSFHGAASQRSQHSRELNARPVAAPRAALLAALAMPLLLAGCKSAPPPPHPNTTTATQAQYPPRPTVPPPAFKVFHHDASSITLVTADNATDAQIESLIWELRDAAHTHTFGKLKIPQKVVDARDPIIWFHIYRGAKCASEKYTNGPPPCGPSYHAAGEYTYGSFANRDRDSGDLLHGEDRTTPLWNPNTPFTASAPAE